jgi:hypothetical protein
MIVYMIGYYPYKSDKTNKNIILLQMIIKNFVFVRPWRLILQYIKMRQEKKDIGQPEPEMYTVMLEA